MKTFVKSLILLPLTVMIVLLSVANRAPVQVSLDPFSGASPLIAFSAPLFVIILGALTVGVIFGGLTVWWSQRVYRRAAVRARLSTTTRPKLGDDSPSRKAFVPS